MSEFRLELKSDRPNANAAYELGEIHRKRGELADARRLFARAIRCYPQLEQARIAFGDVLTSLREPDEALGHLRAAIEINASNEVAHYRMAQTLRLMGREPEAREALGRFSPLREANRSAVALGVANDPSTAQEAEPDPCP